MSEHTPASPETPADSHEKRDFIRQIVREDLASGKHQAIKTRFRRSRTATCTSAMPSRSA
jgi:glutaminyl-tRNA synthetase